MRQGQAAALRAPTLIERCAAGERAALRALYEREAGAMLGVAIRILRRRELAEEVVQDAFIRIWHRAGSYDPARGAERSWIYAVLRNLALNRLRSLGRAPEGDIEAAAEIASDAPGPEAVAAQMSDESLLRRCLETLELERRRAIMLAYMHGLSHGEVAGRMGVPLGTAKAWIRRSLVSLKGCME